MILQKASVTKALYETGAFAVVRVPTVERGCEIAEGLIKGGVHAMEISYTLPNAGEVIAGIKEKFGDEMIVGAGTVMEATTARLAIMSGAQFIVANMMSDEVAQICNLYQIPYAPGCTTMTEANHALSIGAAFVALCGREALLACQTPEFVADRRPTRDPCGTSSPHRVYALSIWLWNRFHAANARTSTQN